MSRKTATSNINPMMKLTFQAQPELPCGDDFNIAKIF